jgi:hypothetical protein
VVRHFHELVRDHPDFEVLEEPAGERPYRFRYLPYRLVDRRDEPAMQKWLDQLNRSLAEAVRGLGIALDCTEFAGGVALRFQPGPKTMREPEADAAFEAIARVGHQLMENNGRFS